MFLKTWYQSDSEQMDKMFQVLSQQENPKKEKKRETSLRLHPTQDSISLSK